eukprot:1250054-Pleurochrysis_carterae.AAC.1
MLHTRSDAADFRGSSSRTAAAAASAGSFSVSCALASAELSESGFPVRRASIHASQKLARSGSTCFGGPDASGTTGGWRMCTCMRLAEAWMRMAAASRAESARSVGLDCMRSSGRASALSLPMLSLNARAGGGAALGRSAAKPRWRFGRTATPRAMRCMVMMALSFRACCSSSSALKCHMVRSAAVFAPLSAEIAMARAPTEQ